MKNAFSGLFCSMKPNKAGKNMRLRAQIANQNLKQNAHTQAADGNFFLRYIWHS